MSNHKKITPTNLIFDLHGVIFDYDGEKPNDSVHILTPGLKILQNCANQIDQFGKKLHKIYILSNWGKIGFTKLKTQFPEIMALFDGCVISGECDYSKPQAEIFELLIARYHLQNQRCIFIDDMAINVAAAAQFGWTGIFYTDPKHVTNLLQTFHVL